MKDILGRLNVMKLFRGTWVNFFNLRLDVIEYWGGLIIRN